jgi:hypothetical protein
MEESVKRVTQKRIIRPDIYRFLRAGSSAVPQT